MDKNTEIYYDTHEMLSNKYAIRCVNIAMIIMLGVWVLNIIGVFPFNETLMHCCMISSAVVYIIGIVCWEAFGVTHRRMKYFIMLWAVMITTIMSTGLTYHAILATVLPILFCSLYSSRRLMIYTTILTIISTFVVVLVGYKVGICDANMALLPGEPLVKYINGAGVFTRININERPIWNLILFFVFPRCLIYIMCLVACYNIGKLNRDNVMYALKMEELALKDGMTGLYNKSNYLALVKEEYPLCENIAVIYWDINNLKIINDTKGHEFGDVLIRTVADSIKKLTNENRRAFRIGGDEFVMIVKEAKEETACELVKSWNEIIEDTNKTVDFEISVAIGYAYGNGKQIDEIIREADQNMYEEKRKYHNKSKDKDL